MLIILILDFFFNSQTMGNCLTNMWKSLFKCSRVQFSTILGNVPIFACLQANICFFSCSYISVLKGNNTLPPEDRLLKFLVDTNADAEETVQCANCDQESNKKVET